VSLKRHILSPLDPTNVSFPVLPFHNEYKVWSIDLELDESLRTTGSAFQEHKNSYLKVGNLCETGCWKTMILEIMKYNLDKGAIQEVLLPDDPYPQEGNPVYKVYLR
jgi:hypothetical protein